jgi:arylsulfatase A-like enzyme
MNYWEIDEQWETGSVKGITHQDSKPWYPPRSKAKGPNIVLIMFDDLGFADLGCYGSEARTPNIDKLAESGHRYNDFHTTTLCSPSRACLLTGRNHHSVGMRMLSNVDSGWPSGRGRITRQAALLSEVLRDAGYNTFAAGKWHIAPMMDASPAGIFDEWPLGRGFNQFYGFMNGATNHFYPELFRDNHAVEPPKKPEDGYHLTDDLIDQSTRYISDHIAHRPDDPFFLYLPLGAAHAPHQAPDKFLESVRGNYDSGWEIVRQNRYKEQLQKGIIPKDTVLPPNNPDVPPWNSLNPTEKKLTSRLQEAYVAFVEHTDQALGRLFNYLDRVEKTEDTLIMVLSDNGAAMEGGRLGTVNRIQFFNNLSPDANEMSRTLDLIGGPLGDSHYATGWAQASNTPLRWYKYHTHGGGIKDPLIISWPGKLISPGKILKQFHHIIDIAPTIYEICEIDPPSHYRGVKQMPIHGTSMAYTFSDSNAKTKRTQQYFEMFGNRGIWSKGWKAVTHHEPGAGYSSSDWELYNLDEDFSESNNLAKKEPKKLEELNDLWWSEAGRYDVLPLDDRSVELFQAPPPPGSPRNRKVFNYYPPVSHIEPSTAPPLGHHSYLITVEINCLNDGVLIAYGDSTSGFVIYMKNENVTYEYNAGGQKTKCSLELTKKCNIITFEFRLEENKSASVRLGSNNLKGKWFKIPRVFSFLALSGMDIGRDSLSPVSPEYEAPFEFLGEIYHLCIELVGKKSNEPYLLDD